MSAASKARRGSRQDAARKNEAIRFAFGEDIVFAEVEEIVFTSMVGTEALHGEVAARLQAGCIIGREARSFVVACSAPAGRDLASLITGYLRRTIGPRAFRIERIALADAFA